MSVATQAIASTGHDTRAIWRRAAVIFCATIFSVAVLLIHTVISPLVFDFSGNLSVDRSLQEDFALVVVAVLPTLWLPVQMRRPSLVGLWLLYLQVYVSTIVVAPHVYDAALSDFVPFFGCLLLSMVGLAVPYSFNVRAVQRPGVSLDWLMTLLISAAGIWVLYTALRVGIVLGFTAQENLYDERFLLRDRLANSGEFFWTYLTKWTSDIVVTVLLALGLINRRPVPIAIGIFLAILISATAAARGPLVAMAFVLGTPLWTVHSKAAGYQFSAVRTFLFLLLGIGVSLGWDLIIGDWNLSFGAEGNFELTHLIFMRIFVIPGMLSGYHFEFFSQNPPALFGESILGWIFDIQPYYSEAVSILIGHTFVYARDTPVVANANTWADWYANLGLVGLVLSSFVVGVLFYLVDKLATGRDFRVAAIAMAPIGIDLANTGVQTAFISGGFWLLLVVLWLLPPVEADN